tara:strand:+ start:1733 stop:2011 length:279 start_codon:yes stop_codon:yes gene_type:complete
MLKTYGEALKKTLAVDYINSEGNLRYTKWVKTFVLFPKVTISGQKIWLKKAFKRQRWLHIEPPQFPVNHFNKVEYATFDEIFNLKMRNGRRS